jgi:hypothetical protein
MQLSPFFMVDRCYVDPYLVMKNVIAYFDLAPLPVVFKFTVNLGVKGGQSYFTD